MKDMDYADLNLLDFGNEIQLFGAVFAGKGHVLVVPLPDEDASLLDGELHVLKLSPAHWEALLRQTDYLNVYSGAKKAILRKSQRQIDTKISWSVFRRDGYACRYCGRYDVPLTVDHIDLWEDGGLTIADNLNSSCRDCNKTRGNMKYEDWIASPEYQKRAARLTLEQRQRNAADIAKLSTLEAMRVAKQRSR